MSIGWLELYLPGIADLSTRLEQATRRLPNTGSRGSAHTQSARAEPRASAAVRVPAQGTDGDAFEPRS